MGIYDKRSTLMVSILNLLFFLTSCYTQEGHRGISEDVQESKKRNVFISECMVSPNPFIINDSLRITVRNGWLENKWAYGSTIDETIIISEYQLIIEVDEDDLTGYYWTWMIGDSPLAYFRPCGKGCLVSDLKSMPNSFVSWPVQKGRELHPVLDKIIIGQFDVIIGSDH
ncbi:MAG TPA: hypothetical protein PKY96_10115 [Flavobacteriales bacterium]|nr:hypothetical protein [Flavobacteriales bacterium]